MLNRKKPAEISLCRHFLRCGLVWEESFPVRGVLLPSSVVLLIVFFLFRVHFLLGPFDQPGKR